MAKFCPKCGTALNDNSAFCGKCGTAIPQDATAAPVVAAPVAETPVNTYVPEAPVDPYAPVDTYAPVAPAKKKLSKKTWITIGAIAGAVVLIIVLLSIFGGALSPQGALDNYVAVMNGDTAKIEKLAPDAYWEFLADRNNMTKQDVFEKLQEGIEENVEELREEYGLYKVTGKIEDEEKISSSTLDKIAKGLSKYGIDQDDVKDAKDLKVTLTLNGILDSEEVTRKIAAVKIGGSWYLINYSVSGSEAYVSFILY